METVIYRRLSPDDESLMFGLFSAVRSEQLQLDGWEPAQRDQMLRMQFRAQMNGYREQFPNFESWLVLSNGSAVGWFMVAQTDGVMHLLDIAVIATERNRGIGTSVIRSLQSQASKQHQRIVIYALQNNDHAIALYTSLGFRMTGEAGAHTSMEWSRMTEEADLGASRIDVATFRAHIDTIFHVQTGGAPIALRLNDVSDYAGARDLQWFSLFFHGPADRQLAQGTYELHHDALGAMAIFLVPVIGSNSERIVYEASFNRPSSRAR